MFKKRYPKDPFVATSVGFPSLWRGLAPLHLTIRFYAFVFLGCVTPPCPGSPLLLTHPYQCLERSLLLEDTFCCSRWPLPRICFTSPGPWAQPSLECVRDAVGQVLQNLRICIFAKSWVTPMSMRVWEVLVSWVPDIQIVLRPVCWLGSQIQVKTFLFFCKPGWTRGRWRGPGQATLFQCFCCIAVSLCDQVLPSLAGGLQTGWPRALYTACSPMLGDATHPCGSCSSAYTWRAQEG